MHIKSLSLDRFLEFIDSAETLPVETAYEDVGWFRRAIDIRAETVQGFPYDIMQAGDVVFTEDILQAQDDGTQQIVEIPDEIDIFPLLNDMAVDLDLYGAFYAVYETNRTGRNGAWRRLHPPSMKPVYDDMRGLVGFERRIPNKGKVRDYTVDEIVYVWIPNRRYETGHGKGLAHSALQAATSLNNVQKFQSAFFENGALNPTIVTIEGYETFNEGEQTRIKRLFKRLMSGIKNAFEIIPVGGNTTVSNLMQPLRDMAMQEMTTAQRETIATAFGIPQSLLMSNAANFATATQDDLNFYDKTIIPLIRLIEWQLNERLFKPNNYVLRFQKSRLEVYQQLEASKVDKLHLMFTDKVIDKNEYRTNAGFAYDEKYETEEEPEPDLTEQIQRLQTEDDTSLEPDTAPEQERQQNELRQWREYASKRYAEGKPEKALRFQAQHIPPALSDSISRTLGHVNKIDSVHTVFDDATLWLSVHA